MTRPPDMFQAPDDKARAQRHGLSREAVDELFQQLVIDARSLLPRCGMSVARMLFEEWLNEQIAENTGPAATVLLKSLSRRRSMIPLRLVKF